MLRNRHTKLGKMMKLKTIALALATVCSVSAHSATVSLTADRLVVNDSVNRTISFSSVITPTAQELNVAADLYVAIQLPDGTLFTYGSDGAWSPAIRPYQTRVSLQNRSQSNLLTITAPVGTPVDTYKFWLVAAKAGSNVGDGANWFGSSSASVQIKPLKVLPSSYENKMAAGEVIGQQNLPFFFTQYAFADFFQTGDYAAISVESQSSGTKPVPDLPGKIHIWKKVNGDWVDATSTLISDQSACVVSRKLLIADFNGDGKPDVFFSCHGYDASPFPGEQQRILLSKPDGTYENKVVPFTAFAHGGSAVDINNDGFADVVLTDTSVRKQPFYLKNNKDGTFSEVAGKMPTSVAPVQLGNLESLPIYSAEFVDVNADGKYDLWFGGSGNSSWNYRSSFYINDGSYSYVNSQRISYSMSADNLTALDMIFTNGTVYTSSVNGDYKNMYVDKTVLATTQTSNIYGHIGTYIADMPWVTWFQWMHLTADNKLVTPEIKFGVKVPLN